MPKVRLDDLRNMTDEELRQSIEGLKDELFKLRCEFRSGRIEKPHKIGLARKKLARIYTFLNERALRTQKGKGANVGEHAKKH